MDFRVFLSFRLCFSGLKKPKEKTVVLYSKFIAFNVSEANRKSLYICCMLP